MSNVVSVQKIYEAFGRGDVPSILGRLAEDVNWEQWPSGLSAAEAGVAYLQPLQGRSEVPKFFQALQGLDFHNFQPYAFLEGDGRVAACVRLEVTVKATGQRFKDDEIHLWTFDNAGLVAGFRHYVDTAKHIAANR